MTLPQQLGKEIRRARKSVGLSQLELSGRILVHQVQLSRWENGENFPSPEVIEKIEGVLGVRFIIQTID